MKEFTTKYLIEKGWIFLRSENNYDRKNVAYDVFYNLSPSDKKYLLYTYSEGQIIYAIRIEEESGYHNKPEENIYSGPCRWIEDFISICKLMEIE